MIKFNLFKRYFNNFYDDISKQDKMLTEAFVFDLVVIAICALYVLLDGNSSDSGSSLLLIFIILVLCGGGVFISYLGLILYFEFKKALLSENHSE